MNLMIGPGDSQERVRLRKLAGQGPFKDAKVATNRPKDFFVLYSEEIVDRQHYLDDSDEDLDKRICTWWQTFAPQATPSTGSATPPTMELIDETARKYAQ